MTTVEEIKAAIGRLSLEERAELAKWMHGWTEDEWDRQMRRDAQAGRLDRLTAETKRRMQSGRLRDLP